MQTRRTLMWWTKVGLNYLSALAEPLHMVPVCCAVCERYNHDLVFDGADMKMAFTAREAINKGKPCKRHVTVM